MTVDWRIAQLARGATALLFPLLWLAGPSLLLAVAIPVGIVAYVVGRGTMARSGFEALPLASTLTPFGESLLVAGSLALAAAALATRALLPLDLVTGGCLVGTALVAHAVALPWIGRGSVTPSAGAKRTAALCGLAGELALGIAGMTVAAQALGETLAGPIHTIQLVASPWPAVLALAFAFLPLIRLSLAECDDDEARRRALEAAALTLSGILLVGLTGPSWWP